MRIVAQIQTNTFLYINILELHVKCHMSGVTCQVPHVSCHVSHVICRVGGVRCPLTYKPLKNICHGDDITKLPTRGDGLGAIGTTGTPPATHNRIFNCSEQLWLTEMLHINVSNGIFLDLLGKQFQSENTASPLLFIQSVILRESIFNKPSFLNHKS